MAAQHIKQKHTVRCAFVLSIAERDLNYHSLRREADGGSGLGARALAVRGGARATREEKRSVGSAPRVRARGDYFDEWANKSHPRNHIVHPK